VDAYVRLLLQETGVELLVQMTEIDDGRFVIWYTEKRTNGVGESFMKSRTTRCDIATARQDIAMRSPVLASS